MEREKEGSRSLEGHTWTAFSLSLGRLSNGLNCQQSAAHSPPPPLILQTPEGLPLPRTHVLLGLAQLHVPAAEAWLPFYSRCNSLYEDVSR